MRVSHMVSSAGIFLGTVEENRRAYPRDYRVDGRGRRVAGQGYLMYLLAAAVQ